MNYSQMYELRSFEKLVLPKMISDSILKLRTTHSTYRPPKLPRRPENWREETILKSVCHIRERTDPEYSDIFAIFNKIALSNVGILSANALKLMETRDESFRLRISMLLFDKAITNHAYASVMAMSAKLLNEEFPEIAHDLKAQIDMFPVLYNMTDTITFPANGDSELVVEWMKQKEKRRGFAKFMIELYANNLVEQTQVIETLNQIDLFDSVVQPMSVKTEENVGQYLELFFEIAKKTTDSKIKQHIGLIISGILQKPKSEVPSLNMRCRFKLEDIAKLCVEKGKTK